MTITSIRSLNELLTFKVKCYPELRESITALEEAVIRWSSQKLDATPCVAFVGRYSTGKSFLINTLINKELLSTKSGQESRCVVSIFHGEDSAFEIIEGSKVAVNLQDFESAISFRGQQSVDSNSELGEHPRFFERRTPSRFLKFVGMLDTPGLDGRERGAFVDAEKGVRFAAKLASLCCVVLPLRGFGALEQSCINDISSCCTNICLIINMSDELDEDEVEWVRTDAQQAMRKNGLIGRVFVVSALWQVSDTNSRDRIRERRVRKGFEPAEPVNEWEQLRSYLFDLATKEHVKRAKIKLDEIEGVCKLAQKVQNDYSRIRQAEYVFSEIAPSLRKHVAPPMGQAYLGLAIEVAQKGEAIPWALLKNIGVRPESFAPQILLSQGFLPEVHREYSFLLTTLCREAGRNFDRGLLRVISKHLDSHDSNHMPEVWEELNFVSWQLETQSDGFTYESSLNALIVRWSSDSLLMYREAALSIGPLKDFIFARIK